MARDDEEAVTVGKVRTQRLLIKRRWWKDWDEMGEAKECTEEKGGEDNRKREEGGKRESEGGERKREGEGRENA